MINWTPFVSDNDDGLYIVKGNDENTDTCYLVFKNNCNVYIIKDKNITNICLDYYNDPFLKNNLSIDLTVEIPTSKLIGTCCVKLDDVLRDIMHNGWSKWENFVPYPSTYYLARSYSDHEFSNRLLYFNEYRKWVDPLDNMRELDYESLMEEPIIAIKPITWPRWMSYTFNATKTKDAIIDPESGYKININGDGDDNEGFTLFKSYDYPKKSGCYICKYKVSDKEEKDILYYNAETKKFRLPGEGYDMTDAVISYKDIKY